MEKRELRARTRGRKKGEEKSKAFKLPAPY